MAIDLDGIRALRAALKRPELFPRASESINALARKIITAPLLVKKIDLNQVRRVYRILDGEDFKLALDALPQKKISSLAKALDPYNGALKKADAPTLHIHLLNLAAQAIEPAVKLEKASKPPRASIKASTSTSRPRPKRTMSSKAMSAVWDGKNHDND